MKLNCIIDTCSCIYLSNAEFQQKPLLKHLFDAANLNYCTEVGIEIRDHMSKGIASCITSQKLRISPRAMSIDEYEVRMIGRTLLSRVAGGSKGELDNFIVAIDQTHNIKRGISIFITDDEKAITGTLAEWFEAYPTIKLWSSFEVILFLYAEKIIPSIDIANELIQQVISIKAPPQGKRSDKTTQQLIKWRTSYNQRLQNIFKVSN